MMLILILTFGIVLYFLYFNDDGIKHSDNFEPPRCYNCGYELEESYNFCPNCRERLKKHCSSCGRLIGVNWRYCPYCNAPNSDGEA